MPILLSLRIDSDHPTRAALAEILGYVGQPRDNRVLISMLEHVATPAEMSRLARGIGALATHQSYATLRDMVRSERTSATVRATAMDALAMMFSTHPGRNLARLAQNANFLLFPGWLARLTDLNL